jgi:N-acylneuraminate cytidylyltransferase
MYKQLVNLKVLCIIPARGGSKGLPGKNIKEIAGKPLVAHTIEQAVASKIVQRIIVSTDDEKIAQIARQYGAEVIIRPEEISGDDASSEAALMHTVNYLSSTEGYTPNLIVFLQCTSPLREDNDIDTAISTLMDSNADSLLSVSPSHRFMWRLGDNGPEPINYDYNNRLPRQMLPIQYVENGSIYVFKPWILSKNNNRLGGVIALHVMSENASIEIDSQLDFDIVERLLKSRD